MEYIFGYAFFAMLALIWLLLRFGRLFYYEANKRNTSDNGEGGKP